MNLQTILIYVTQVTDTQVLNCLKTNHLTVSLTYLNCWKIKGITSLWTHKSAMVESVLAIDVKHGFLKHRNGLFMEVS
jgi:hypothetical protein